MWQRKTTLLIEIAIGVLEENSLVAEKTSLLIAIAIGLLEENCLVGEKNIFID